MEKEENEVYELNTDELAGVNQASSAIVEALNELNNFHRGIALAHALVSFYGQEAVAFLGLLVPLISDIQAQLKAQTEEVTV